MKAETYGLTRGAAAETLIMSTHTHTEQRRPSLGEYGQHRDISSCGSGSYRAKEAQLKRSDNQEARAKQYPFNVVFDSTAVRQGPGLSHHTPMYASSPLSTLPTIPLSTVRQSSPQNSLARSMSPTRMSDSSLDAQTIPIKNPKIQSKVIMNQIDTQDEAGSAQTTVVESAPISPSTVSSPTESQSGKELPGNLSADKELSEFTPKVDKNFKDERRRKFLERNRLAGMYIVLNPDLKC